jgi:hypothetical protein
MKLKQIDPKIIKLNKLILKDKSASSEIIKNEKNPTLDNFQNWLTVKGVLLKNQKLIQWMDGSPWKRNGSETYSCTVNIRYMFKGLEFQKKINIKAIVSIPINENLDNWAVRRNLLFMNGIPVSNWYYYGEGIIIEDFYPHSIDVLKEKTALKDIAFKLDQLGFHALNFLRDLRCDQNGNPYYIDFGFDLGEPRLMPTTKSINLLKEIYPKLFN